MDDRTKELLEITVQGPLGPSVTYRFDQDAITIGRSPGNHLVVRDSSLSRVHAEIRRVDGAWVAADCGSSNGTLLDGRPLVRAERLSPGAVIQVGRTVLTFATAVAGAIPEREEAATDRITWSARGSGPRDEPPLLVSRSAAFRSVLETVERIGPSPASVLIVGENGTGKEVIARLIHRHSPRRDRPFVVVNCPALPGSLLEAELFGVEKGVATGVEPRPGRFEVASGGTLLLDEVGDMELTAQAKILRVLQERSIERLGGREPRRLDVRILAATHHDLDDDIARGSFRRDLFHRLNTLTIAVPPLRDRREDIPLLVEHFLSRSAGARQEMSAEALEILMRYGFPGNVRELEHLVERASLLARGPRILPDDLPEPVRQGSPPEAGGGAGSEETIASLYERIVRDGESFWDVVQRPYLRRELARDDVRSLVERAYQEAGGSYKGVASLFHIEGDHKKLLNFLRNHKLGIKE